MMHYLLCHCDSTCLAYGSSQNGESPQGLLQIVLSINLFSRSGPLFLLASLELWLASPLRWHWLRRRSSLQRRATASGYIQQLLAVLLAFTPAAPGRSAVLTAYLAGLAEAVLPRPPFVYYRSSLMVEKRRSWANFAASSVLHGRCCGLIVVLFCHGRGTVLLNFPCMADEGFLSWSFWIELPVFSMLGSPQAVQVVAAKLSLIGVLTIPVISSRPRVLGDATVAVT